MICPNDSNQLALNAGFFLNIGCILSIQYYEPERGEYMFIVRLFEDVYDDMNERIKC